MLAATPRCWRSATAVWHTAIASLIIGGSVQICGETSNEEKPADVAISLEAKVLLMQNNLRLTTANLGVLRNNTWLAPPSGSAGQRSLVWRPATAKLAEHVTVRRKGEASTNVSTEGWGSLPVPEEIMMEMHTSLIPVKSKWVLALLEVLALGFCGIDRCYMGQVCLGVVKGCTLGGLGIWFFMDYIVVLIACLSQSSSIHSLGYHAIFMAPATAAPLALATVSLCLAAFVLGGATVASMHVLVARVFSSSRGASDWEEGATPTAVAAADVSGGLEEEEEAKLVEYGGPVPLRKLLSTASPARLAAYAAGLGCAALQGAAEPLAFLYLGQFLDAAAGDASLPSFSGGVGRAAAGLALLGLYAAVLGAGQRLCVGHFADSEARRLRPLYFQAVLHRDIAWFDCHNVELLPAEMDEDLEAFREGLGTKLSSSLTSTSTAAIGLVVAFCLSWQVALTTALCLPAIALVAFAMEGSTQDVVQERQRAYTEAARAAEELLPAARTVVALGAERKELLRYDRAAEEARSGGVRTRTKLGVGLGLMNGLLILSYALAFFVGMQLVSRGADLTAGRVVAAFLCVILGALTASSIPVGLAALSNARVRMARFFFVVENQGVIEKHLHDDGELCLPIDTVELKDVHLSYPARPTARVLRGVSLFLRRGQKLALVGAPGSGKSSVVALLERFYDPTAGVVYVNGVDLRRLSVASYRSHIGYAGQEPVLFATSIGNNILQGSAKASMQDVKRVARYASMDFVEDLPEKFDTSVSGGSELSRGQKQRVALARALVGRPSLLLLDEATSALDVGCERTIHGALEYLRSSSEFGMTVLCVSRRLGAIQNSDVIFVMKEGEVVERGTHPELAKAGGVYSALAAAQTSAQAEADAPAVAPAAAPAAAAAPQRLPGAAEGAASAGGYEAPMVRLLSLCRPERWGLVPGVLGAVLNGSILPLMGACVMGGGPSSLGEELRRSVNQDCRWFLLLAIGKVLGAGLHFGFFGFVGEALAKRCRVAMLRAIFCQEVGFHDHPDNAPARLAKALQLNAFRASTLITRVGDKVEASAAILVGVCLAFAFQWRMALVMLAAMGLVMSAQLLQGQEELAGSEAESEASRRGSKVLTDSLRHARTVHAAGSARRAVELYGRIVASEGDRVWRTNCMAALADGLSSGLSLWAMAWCFWLMGLLIGGGAATYDGCIRAYNGIIFAGIGAAEAFALGGDTTKAATAARAVLELLDRKPAIHGLEPDGPVTMDEKEQIGRLEFAAVQFFYPWREEVQVLRELSFTIQANQSVGLVGPSGGGKSALLSIIQRCYDPQAGQVLIGKTQRPLTSLNVRWWRRQVGFVGREPILFDATVLENVKYGLDKEEEPLSDTRLEEVKHLAHLGFLDGEEHGWDAPIGPRGSRLSMGQKQRVAIARSLLRNPPILLFDEATGSLDAASEKVVSQAIAEARKDRTSISVTQHLPSIQDCDVILVLADGRLVESGSHQQLMKAKGAYAKLQGQASGAGGAPAR